MRKILQKLGLKPGNSIVISSGILQALGIRKSKDIDIVVSETAFRLLRESGKFKVINSQHRITLADDTFEIGTDWIELGKTYRLEDLIKESIVIGGVRYITIDFLYKVKKSWLDQKVARQKDIIDVKLIEEYLREIRTRRP